MDFESWVREHSVGDPLLDAYHHIFFQMVENIEKVAAEEGPEHVHERLGFLEDYAVMHFDTEERILREAGYPQTEDHHAHHDGFRQKVQQLKADILEDPTEPNARRIVELARHYLMDHILYEDMKFAPCLKARGK